MNTNKTQHEHLAELVYLISQLRFTSDQADLRKGEHWTVYAHPWPNDEDEQKFNAQITVTSAAEFESIEKMKLVIRRGNVSWLSRPLFRQSFNQHRMQFFLEGLPADMEPNFAVRLSLPRKWPKDLISKAKEIARSIADAASSWQQYEPAPLTASPEQSQERSLPRQHTYYPDDLPIVALLSEGLGDQAVLTIQTDSPEFDTADIRFEFQDETGEVTEAGEVTLSPFEQGQIWRGSYYLQQSFDTAVACIPSFEKTPKKTEESNDDL